MMSIPYKASLGNAQITDPKFKYEERVGVLSKIDLDDRHVLFWDYDLPFNEYRYGILKKIADEFNLDLLVLKTKHGQHFIDLHLFTFKEIREIQERISESFPSDYPTLSKIYAEDLESNTEFKGATLCIKPSPEITHRIISKNIDRDFSKGHLDLYRLVLEKNIFLEGQQLNTNISLVGYITNKGDAN